MGYRTSKNSTQRLDFYHGAGECEKRGYAHDGHTPIKFQFNEFKKLFDYVIILPIVPSFVSIVFMLIIIQNRNTFG